LFNKCLNHYVFVPAGNENNIKAWLNSGFAFQQVYGVASALKHETTIPSDVVIIEASPKDVDDLKSVSNLIMSFQAGSPTFAVGLPEEVSSIKKGYGGLATDDEATVLLAYKNDKLLGFQCGFDEENDDHNMMVPVNSYEITVGGTIVDAQGLGIGSLLVKELQNKAVESGVENFYTDIETAKEHHSTKWCSFFHVEY